MESEIRKGLVLHLDPDVLEAEGGTYTCPPERRVQGGHFFVCIRHTGDSGRWLPAYSQDGDRRVAISKLGRQGHPKWTDMDCYYHPNQVWTASDEAISKAAIAGKDQSEAGNPNWLHEASIPNV